MYDIRRKAFLPALVGTRKCCQRSTMDPAAKPPSLHTHIVRCSQETKKGGRGNVQKLNYGSPGRASLAPHAHLSARAAHPPGWAPRWTSCSGTVRWPRCAGWPGSLHAVCRPPRPTGLASPEWPLWWPLWVRYPAEHPARARSAGHGAKAGQEALAKRDGNPYQVDYAHLALDPAVKAPSLHTHILWRSQGTARQGRGNVQELNYGSPPKRPFASRDRLPVAPGEGKVEARKCSKT